MMKIAALFLVLLVPNFLLAETVVPIKTIRAHSKISETDVALRSLVNSRAYDRIADVVGQEAKITLYAGKPILFDDIGPPALIDRNQIVLLEYKAAGLVIATEGRALQRGGAGDRIRIMNLDSRTTVFGVVQADGSVRVNK